MFERVHDGSGFWQYTHTHTHMYTHVHVHTHHTRAHTSAHTHTHYIYREICTLRGDWTTYQCIAIGLPSTTHAHVQLTIIVIRESNSYSVYCNTALSWSLNTALYIIYVWYYKNHQHKLQLLIILKQQNNNLKLFKPASVMELLECYCPVALASRLEGGVAGSTHSMNGGVCSDCIPSGLGRRLRMS